MSSDLPLMPRCETDVDDVRPVGPGRDAQLIDLYRKHFSELVCYIFRTCGPGPPEPEDAVQAAFASFAALAHPERIENPRAYLFRSARNFISEQRRRMNVRRRGQSVIISGSENADEMTGERILEGKQAVEIINEALLKMEPQVRDALLMYKVEGKSFQAVARALGVSETWAKKLVARALVQCEGAIRRANKSAGRWR